MAGATRTTRDDKRRPALDIIRDDRGGSRGALQTAYPARYRFRRLLAYCAHDLPLVETGRAATTSTGTAEMKQAIIGFDRDDELHWRAKLACGHYQHVRHDPPLRVREWVLTEEGRDTRIGANVDCRKCDEDLPNDFVI